ncbi:hypothetical protein ACVWYN_001380 [Pedobacter sp. UYP24]
MKTNFSNSLKVLTLIGFTFCAKVSIAQDSGSGTVFKNQVKMNVAALILKNFSFQYQRAVASKIAVGLSVRFAPESTLPFQGQIESLVNDAQAYKRIRNFKTGNFAITPEVRFYLGKQAFKGFYLAPFASFSNFNASGPYLFQSSQGDLEIPLSGNIKTVTGGLYIGSEFNLAKRIGLDVFIGPNYGSLMGTIAGTKTLSNDEQNGLRNGLNDLGKIPMINTKYTVDGNGASVDLDGNFPGLRGGISVSYKF